MVTVVDLGEPVSVLWALPAVSVIEKPAAAVRVERTATPSASAVDVAVMVHTVDDVWTMPVIAEMLVNAKSVPDVVDKVEHVMASFPVTVKVMVPEVDVADDAAKVAVGAVVSAMVTVVDLGEPVSVLWALPAVSVIEKPAAAVRVERTATPSASAVDVAVMVHTVDDVWTMPVIAEMLVNAKSVPDVVDKVEHVMASFPVTVKVMVPEVDVADVAAKVAVGAVISAPAGMVTRVN